MKPFKIILITIGTAVLAQGIEKNTIMLGANGNYRQTKFQDTLNGSSLDFYKRTSNTAVLSTDISLFIKRNWALGLGYSNISSADKTFAKKDSMISQSISKENMFSIHSLHLIHIYKDFFFSVRPAIYYSSIKSKGLNHYAVGKSQTKSNKTGSALNIGVYWPVNNKWVISMEYNIFNINYTLSKGDRNGEKAKDFNMSFGRNLGLNNLFFGFAYLIKKGRKKEEEMPKTE